MKNKKSDTDINTIVKKFAAYTRSQDFDKEFAAYIRSQDFDLDGMLNHPAMKKMMESVFEMYSNKISMNSDEIIRRCGKLLHKFYNFYKVENKYKFLNKDHSHLRLELNILECYPNMLEEYNFIWNIIENVKEYGTERLHERDLYKLNNLYKKYTEGI